MLPFGINEADEAGALAENSVGIGQHTGFADATIAGTVKANHLIVVTENGKHFEPLAAFGVIINDLAGMV